MAYPTKYTPELVARFLELVSEGNTPTAVCKMEGMPRRATVSAWVRQYPDFARQLQIAREEMAHAMAEESVEIADTDPDPQRARNRIETRRWLAGCVRPKSYGPKAHLDVTIEERTDFHAVHQAALARVVRMTKAEAELRGRELTAVEALRLGLVQPVDAEIISETVKPARDGDDPFS